MAYTYFEKADLKYRDVIYEWLEYPHVKEFWDNSQDFKDDLSIFINGRKSHSSYFNGIFTYWIGKIKEEPYCLVMTSEVVINESLPQVWKDNISESGKTYTIDFCIGNKNYLGRGLASFTLETFTKFFQENVDNSADAFFIDPDENNPRAEHVYEKAGFKLVGTFDMGIGFFKGHKSLLMVKKLSNLMMNYRQIELNDINQLFIVRSSTDENNLSYQQLKAAGITEKSVKEKLSSTHKGWVCEIDNKVVGFSIGDKSTGEVWVMAVLPEYINRGIGAKLLSLVENWLWNSGCTKLWLETDIDPKLRAYSFYKKNGWQDDYIENENRYMKKVNSQFPLKVF